jgi:hypothetical protein
LARQVVTQLDLRRFRDRALAKTATQAESFKAAIQGVRGPLAAAAALTQRMVDSTVTSEHRALAQEVPSQHRAAMAAIETA